MKKLWSLIKETFAEWSEDKASRLAAALSYYTIFSLAPLLVIAIAIAGFVFGEAAAQGAIVRQMSGLLGQEGAQQIQTMIQNANRPGAGIVATIVGVVTLLLGATGVFGALQDAMDTIWEVKQKPNSGIMAMIKDRFLSFTMVLGIGFLLLVSLLLTAALSGLGTLLGDSVPFSETIMQVVNFLVSFLVITFLFGAMFKFLPAVNIAWKDALIGGAVTSLLFSIGKLLIGLYLGSSSVASPYGAAGSLIIILIWVYYSGQILFFGAEFTEVYSRKFGTPVTPKEGAVFLSEEERARQGMPPKKAIQPGGAEAGAVAQPAGPRVAVPSRAAVPVTSGVALKETTGVQSQQEQIVEAAMPMVVAFLVGIGGSLLIAREQRKRPLVTAQRGRWRR